MTSSQAGKNISEIEILNISEFGIWIMILGVEYFMPYDEFSWFKNATVEEICNVELLHQHHLYWPKLDVDLSINILNNPDHYPLKCKPKIMQAVQKVPHN